MRISSTQQRAQNDGPLVRARLHHQRRRPRDGASAIREPDIAATLIRQKPTRRGERRSHARAGGDIDRPREAARNVAADGLEHRPSRVGTW